MRGGQAVPAFVVVVVVVAMVVVVMVAFVLAAFCLPSGVIMAVDTARTVATAADVKTRLTRSY